ncbi:MAG: helix-turn-helix domain-containing protein [Candidatus Shapirobacteria bacterium]|nr:helix-turn-helix domain-containing protein [Candidatus Shapirobacteria bacterium]
MKTVGQILQKNRIDKKISLEQVAFQTKIRKDILIALEADEFQRISSIASIKGLLKSYAEFLDLSSEQILAIFRRDFSRKEKKKIIPSGFLKPIGKRQINLTPKITMVITIIFFFLILAGWLSYQYLSLVRAPFLKINYPMDKIQVKEKTIEIYGQADVDSLVTVNMETVLLSPQGEFHYQVTLFPGENDLVIEAANKNGRKNKIERIIFYQE